MKNKKTENARELVKQFMKERGWDDQPLEDVAKSIVIEAAELLEHFQWSAFFSDKLDPETRKKVIEELADVTIYINQMSILLDCDLDIAVSEKLKLSAKKYPAHIFKGNKDPKVYWETKKEHRRKQ